MSAPLRIVVAEGVPARRAELVTAVESGGEIVVVAQAGSAQEAADAVLRERPDAAILALELLGEGSDTSIARIMSEHAVALLVLSDCADQRDGGDAVRAARRAGVADVRPRPARWTSAETAALQRRLHILGRVPMVTRRSRRPRPPEAPPSRARGIIALGASTGGPQALAIVLASLRGVDVPIVCVQHIHASFAREFAPWLAKTADIAVRLAEDGMALSPGAVHIAPADSHMRVAGGRIVLSDSPTSIHRPSIDELFTSVAAMAGRAAAAALLTGMGADGARGLLEIRTAGGATFAQDRATSAVHGMPAVADRLGAVQQMLALEQIGPALRATFARRAA